MRKYLLNSCLTAIMLLVSTVAMAVGYNNGVPVQIGSAEDLKAFAELVNSSETDAMYANAVLTADIDYGTESTMIGTDGHDYMGCFDGQGHTITINMLGKGDYQSLFKFVGRLGQVKNLCVKGTITTEYKFAAGIAGDNYGTITNCFVDLTVNSNISGDATHGGICGRSMNGSVIANNLIKFTINGPGSNNCGGVIGWTSDRSVVENCLVIADFNLKDLNDCGTIARNPGNIRKAYNNFYCVDQTFGKTDRGIAVTEDELKSGKICFILNNDQSDIQWTQNIGEDDYPVPFKTRSQVYCSVDTDCDGTTEAEDAAYSNAPAGGTPTKHTLEAGSCTACESIYSGNVNITLKPGYLVPNYLPRDAEGWYHVKSGDDMMYLAELFALGNCMIAVKLDNDIDFTGYDHWLICEDNSTYKFRGDLDGQYHTLTINLTPESPATSIIPHCAGNVSNIIIAGNISTAGQFAGAITSHTRSEGGRNAHLTNVVSTIDINSTHSGDGTHGGIIGVSDSECWMENCIFTGSIVSENTTNCGGLVGWANGVVHATNCAQIGVMAVVEDDNSDTFSRNNTSFRHENSYYLNPFGKVPGGAVQITEDDIRSGALAFMLNKNSSSVLWTQNIGEDEFPLPFPTRSQVYAQPTGGYRCDGLPLGDVNYTNTPQTVVIPDHQFHDGFCDVCSTFDMDYQLTMDADSVYQISNGRELAAFGHIVTDRLETAAKAALTADIDMEEYNQYFTSIAREEKAPFTGHLNGQFHTISNLKIENALKGVGLVGSIAGPAIVENLKLDNTCSIIGDGYVGLIGFSTPAGGTVTLRNLGNEGYVKSMNGANAGGIIGCCMNNTATILMSNCYVTGNVDGPKENGALSGWVGGNATVSNCWSTSEVTGIENTSMYLFRPTLNETHDVNNYALYGDQGHKMSGKDSEDDTDVFAANSSTQIRRRTTDELLNGELAWKLNSEQWIEPVWYQTISLDEHPETFPTHGVVYKYNGEVGSIYDQSSLEQARQNYMLGEAAYLDRDDIYVQQELIDQYREAIEVLADIEETHELALAVDELFKQKKPLEDCAAAYDKYVKRGEEIMTELEERDDFEGDFRDILEEYFSDYDGPSDQFPNGMYYYVIDERTLSAEEITAELAFMEELRAQALKYGYIPGSDITTLLVNPNFEQSFETGWEGKLGSGRNTYNVAAGRVSGAESWATSPFDMHQTVTGLKDGIYLLQMNAAARPSNGTGDPRSSNYSASIYLNDNINYIMTGYEARIAKEDAIDGVNANIKGEVSDIPVKDEFDVDTIAFIPQGILSIAIAAAADRAKNYVAVEVTDGTLTVGVKNRYSYSSNDWTGFANAKLFYLGEIDDEPVADGLDLVLNGQVDRINTLLEYEPTFDTSYKTYPNFSNELRAQLADLSQQAEQATDNAEKLEIIGKISQLFEEVYDNKHAYISMLDKAETLYALVDQVRDLLDADQIDGVESAYYDVWDAYTDGNYSTEEALNAEALAPYMEFFPEQDENGVFQIKDRYHMVFFGTYVRTTDVSASANLLNDIDMSDIAFNSIGDPSHRYAGTFDGQGHTISNLSIEGGDFTGLFGQVGNCTIKNFILDKTCTISGAAFVGLVGGTDSEVTVNIEQVGVEATIRGSEQNAAGIIGCNKSNNSTYNISNCYVSGVIIGGRESAAISGWTGGSKATIKNTWATAEVTGIDNEDHYFYRNDDTTTSGNYTKNGKQGTQITDDIALTGQMTYALNGNSSENPVWFQTLGTDSLPRLFNGGTVYYYGGEYSNDVPVIELNSYAYDVKSASDENQATILYTLNSPAKAAKIDFYAGETLVYTEELAGDQLVQGDHSVNVENSKLGEAGTEITFKVSVESIGVLQNATVGEAQSFYAPYGIAINNLPESSTFGTAFVSESAAHPDNYGFVSDEREGNEGVYAFTPQNEIITASDGIAGFTGGLTFNSASPLSTEEWAGLEPKAIRISEDGRLFIGRMGGNTNSPIVEANLEDLNAPWTPVFTGGTLNEEDGVTYIGDDMQIGMVVSFDVEGAGDNLKLYTLSTDAVGFAGEDVEHYYAHTFNLGTKTAWNTVPSSVYEPLDSTHWTVAPGPVNVVTDRQGGLWYIQYRSNPNEDEPALKHFNSEGVVDYSNTNRAQPAAGMAISADGSWIAIPTGNNTVTIYKVDYTPNDFGLITLQGRANFSTPESQITGLAFDYANNIWTTSRSTGNNASALRRYVVPGLLSETDNITVTPSNSAANFIVGQNKEVGIKNVEVDGDNTIYTIGGVRVEKAQKGVNIINGKKVLVK